MTTQEKINSLCKVFITYGNSSLELIINNENYFFLNYNIENTFFVKKRRMCEPKEEIKISDIKEIEILNTDRNIAFIKRYGLPIELISEEKLKEN
jgi:hypothetical protein